MSCAGTFGDGLSATTGCVETLAARIHPSLSRLNLASTIVSPCLESFPSTVAWPGDSKYVEWTGKQSVRELMLQASRKIRHDIRSRGGIPGVCRGSPELLLAASNSSTARCTAVNLFPRVCRSLIKGIKLWVARSCASPRVDLASRIRIVTAGRRKWRLHTLAGENIEGNHKLTSKLA